MKTYGLKGKKLKGYGAFKEVMKGGSKVSVKGAKLFYKREPSFTDRNCVGFTLVHGYGNAVKRNKSRRYSREAYRLLQGEIKVGYKMVFLLYPGDPKDPGGESLTERKKLFSLLCKKAALMRDTLE